MCMLIVSKPGAVVPRDYLEHSLSWNRDGSGFAYISPLTDKVVIDKNYTSKRAFLDKYDELISKKANDKAMIIHMRLATVGKRDVANMAMNCHPFAIKGGAMAHNGTFFGRGSDYNGKSDSAVFADELKDVLTLENMERNWPAIDKAIGYSRVAFLYDGGRYLIASEEAGNWEGDVWYSNMGYRRGK